MILKREIESIAEEMRVPKSTIDKDWVLGHFIDAIFSQPECHGQLVFKGGTCLRKCYIPDYRFSEDLDFTSTNTEFVFDEPLLKRITAILNERVGLHTFIQSLNPLYSNDQLTGYSAVVKYWGADHPRNQPPPVPDRWTTSIKIEIILYEQLIFPKVELHIHHPYSDVLSGNPLLIPCYSIQEVLAEKLRALIQRSYTAPRDFYDIWFLSNQFQGIQWSEVAKAFNQKMRFKGLDFSGVDQLINEENDKRVRTAWENSLGHQIPKKLIPEFDTVKNELKILFDHLFGDVEG
jgi:predicted nucleotidyltransferase component of viral defense system